MDGLFTKKIFANCQFVHEKMLKNKEKYKK